MDRARSLKTSVCAYRRRLSSGGLLAVVKLEVEGNPRRRNGLFETVQTPYGLLNEPSGALFSAGP